MLLDLFIIPNTLQRMQEGHLGQGEAREFQARGLEEKVREAEELAARLPLEVISMTMVLSCYGGRDLAKRERHPLCTDYY